MSQIPEWIYSKLCYYDLRNPDGVKDVLDIYDEEEQSKFGPHSRPDCGCDNCFYGRAQLANYIIDNVKPTP
jgi:hypothetical protein